MGVWTSSFSHTHTHRASVPFAGLLSLLLPSATATESDSNAPDSSLHISGLPVVKHLFPSAASAHQTHELWNFGKKAIQRLDLLWKINSFYESKNVYPSLVESILISNITCNLKARNKTLTRVADIAKISQIIWKIAVRHKHNTTRIYFSCSAKSNYESD